MGEPIKAPTIKDADDRYIFRYTMPKGEVIGLIYEEDRIFYKDQWYHATETVMNTVGNMFAGYF